MTVTPETLGIGRLFDTIREAVVVADVETGRIVLWNRAAAAIFGHSPEQALGQKLEILMPPDMRALHHHGLDRYRKTGHGDLIDTHKVLELPAIHRDGHPISIEMSLSPVDDAPIGGRWALAIIRDVSERKRAEELRAQNLLQQREIEHLKELDRFKTQFLNTTAHELATPLTPIRLQMALLKQAASGTGQSRAFDVMERNLDRLAHLMEDILDAARLQSERLSVSKRPIDLADVVRDAVETFRATADQKGLTLDLDARPTPVDADPNRLTQVLLNYLSNATKFTPQGGRIRVVCRPERDGGAVRVTDSGVGLTPEQMQKLFQPFVQVHETTSTNITPGSGLGLYISRGIAELHGGSVGCDSEGADRGTTFWLWIPAK